MVQATSDSNFDAERLSEALEEGEVEKKEISEGNFDSDYEMAQEFATPDSNREGSGSNQTSNQTASKGKKTGAFSGSTGQSGNPSAFREMAHEVQPDDDDQ